MKKIKDRDNLIILILLVMLVSTIILKKVQADSVLSSKVSMTDNTSTTLQSRIDALTVKYKNKTRPTSCPSNMKCYARKAWADVAVGDYIKMTPTKTSYTIDTSKTGTKTAEQINPSELDLWRVINKKNDGTIEIISEYVSSVGISFSGKDGYINYVGYLNTIANQYQNSKYTIGSRYMGYNGQTEILTDLSAINETSNTVAPWSCSTGASCNPEESKGGGDKLYQNDTNLVTNALGTLIAHNANDHTTASYYWLASRYYYYSSASCKIFRGSTVSKSGSVSTSDILKFNCSSGSGSYSIRPILTLKSGISASSALGTIDDPYVLP